MSQFRPVWVQCMDPCRRQTGPLSREYGAGPQARQRTGAKGTCSFPCLCPLGTSHRRPVPRRNNPPGREWRKLLVRNIYLVYGCLEKDYYTGEDQFYILIIVLFWKNILLQREILAPQMSTQDFCTSLCVNYMSVKETRNNRNHIINRAKAKILNVSPVMEIIPVRKDNRKALLFHISKGQFSVPPKTFTS